MNHQKQPSTHIKRMLRMLAFIGRPFHALLAFYGVGTVRGLSFYRAHKASGTDSYMAPPPPEGAGGRHLSTAGIFAVALTAIAPLTAHAQERLTLRDAVARALAHNYDIRMADAVAQQAAENNTLGNAGFLPNVTGNAFATKGASNTYIEFTDGRVQNVPNAGSTTVNAQLNVTWTLFDGGRMFLAKRQLNAMEALGNVQLKEQVQATVAQVLQAYAQAVWQQQQGIAIDTGLALAIERMNLSQAKFEIGTSAKVDYLQARVDYNARRSDSLAQVANLQAAFASLAVLMGEEAENKIYIVDDSLNTNTGLAPKDAERLRDLNLTLDVFRRTAEISRLDERILRAARYPTLAASGGFAFNRTINAAGVTALNRGYGPTGTITMTVPLYQGGNIRRQAAVAGLQAVRDELAYARQNTELGRQYRTAWANYRVAVNAYDLEQENIGYAKENLEIQRARFRVGVAGTLETREAENSYIVALVRLYTAAYNLKIAETTVLQLEGGLVE